MISTRFDLRHLRLLLALVAITLGLFAAAPFGASAQPNTGEDTDATAGAKKDCEKGGGTWTIDGTKAYCKGMGWPKDYSCDLTINPNGTACSHLPKRVSSGPIVRGTRVVRVENAGVFQAQEATPVPTRVAIAASTDGMVMSPLDE